LTALDIQKADTTTATVVISVDRFNIRFQHRLLFGQPDCMGPAKFRDTIADSDFPPAITMSFVGGVPDQPDVRKLYVQADETEIPAMFLVQSISAEGTCISPVNFMSPSVSAELVDGQLHLTHPGPYTLEGPADADGGGPFAEKVVAFGRVGAPGQIIYNGTGNFTVQHVAGTGVYDITINETMDCSVTGGGLLRALGIIVATSAFNSNLTAGVIGHPTLNDCLTNNPAFRVVAPFDTLFHFQIIGEPAPTP